MPTDPKPMSDEWLDEIERTLRTGESDRAGWTSTTVWNLLHEVRRRRTLERERAAAEEAEHVRGVLLDAAQKAIAAKRTRACAHRFPEDVIGGRCELCGRSGAALINDRRERAAGGFRKPPPCPVHAANVAANACHDCDRLERAYTYGSIDGHAAGAALPVRERIRLRQQGAKAVIDSVLALPEMQALTVHDWSMVERIAGRDAPGFAIWTIRVVSALSAVRKALSEPAAAAAPDPGDAEKGGPG